MAIRYLTRTMCRNNVSPLLIRPPVISAVHSTTPILLQPITSLSDDLRLLMQLPRLAMYSTRTVNHDATKKHKTTLDDQAQLKFEVEKQLHSLKAEIAQMKFQIKKQKEKAKNAEMRTELNKTITEYLKKKDIIRALLNSEMEKQLHPLMAKIDETMCQMKKLNEKVNNMEMHTKLNKPLIEELKNYNDNSEAQSTIEMKLADEVKQEESEDKEIEKKDFDEEPDRVTRTLQHALVCAVILWLVDFSVRLHIGVPRWWVD